MADLYNGVAWTDSRAWEALVELARSIVRIADQDAGANVDFANVHVSDEWDPKDDAKRPGHKIEMCYVTLTYTMPAPTTRAALCRAKVLEHDDALAKDQEIRASLIEME